MYKKIIMICFLMLITLGCQPDYSSDGNIEKEETPTETRTNEDTETSETSAINKDVDEEEKNGEEDKKETRKEKTASSEPTSTDTDSPSRASQGELTVDYMDVGQGDATLIQYESKKESYTILYDTGDWLGDEVVPFLQEKNIDMIDLVIISHPHADHIGQLEKVMQQFDVKEVWMSGNTANSDVFQNALQAVLDSDADYDEPTAGNVYDIGPLTLTILHPDDLTGKLNEDSLSVHLIYKNESFLFTGDAGVKEEKQMMSRGLPIAADYIQLGHHGSNTSSGEEFINTVQPSTAIYSAGKDNKYGHPHQEVVSLMEEKGIPLYGTDEYGTITVTSDGENSTVQTERKSTNKEENQSSASNENDNTSDCININEATKEELMDIKHIGEVRAQNLINKRPFDSLDDLMEIKGIGEARLSDIKQEQKACIGGDNA